MTKTATLWGAVLLLLCSFGASAFADTYVRGYTKKNGTYVQPHYRSSPDRSYNNNWSVKPNVNPYTGDRGTRSPTYNDQPPTTPNYDYGVPRQQQRGLYR